MRHWVRYIGVLLLTGMLVLGIGLRGLPAPCQNGQCGSGGCATALHPCPPSCTCHWAHGSPGDCCEATGHDLPGNAAAHHDHAGNAAAHPDHAVTATGGQGHVHGTDPSAHCAPSAPAADDRWPNFSLPPVQPPALLAAGLTLDLPALPAQTASALPAVIAWAQPPPIRPPAA